jgi:hypothetical protein
MRAHANASRKESPSPAIPALIGIQLSPHIVCGLFKGGALSMRAHANASRKESPSPAIPAPLGIQLSPHIVCGLIEAAPPVCIHGTL